MSMPVTSVVGATDRHGMRWHANACRLDLQRSACEVFFCLFLPFCSLLPVTAVGLRSLGVLAS